MVKKMGNGILGLRMVLLGKKKQLMILEQLVEKYFLETLNGNTISALELELAM